MRKRFGFVTFVMIMMMSVLFSMEVFAAEEAVAVEGNQDWKWPVPTSDRMSSCYLDGRRHHAIDIQADKGEEVFAAYEGQVIAVFNSCKHNYKKSYSCCDGGLGNNVYIRHIYNGKNYVSRYAHLTEAYVTVGEIVTTDTVIGTVGCTGYSSGHHLDFRVYKGYTEQEDSKANAIDPLKEQFIDLPETFHANATTWCCYRYEEEIKTIYAENPKDCCCTTSSRVIERVRNGEQVSFISDYYSIQIEYAMFGNEWNR